MRQYVADMIQEFPKKINEDDTAMYPANEDLFGQKKAGKVKLNKDKAENFHTFVAKGLFLAKRGRPDILPTIEFLCTQVKEPSDIDWKKLKQLMKYLNNTRDEILTLGADNLNVIKWFVGAGFAVHPDY